jgi:NTE family protein
MKIFTICFMSLLLATNSDCLCQVKYNDRILVVGGGGARGAWGAGFAKYLDSINGRYKIVFGTSTGSLMAPLIVLGKFDKLEDAYTSVTQESIFNKNPFKMTANKQKLKIFNFLKRMIWKKNTLGESKNLLSLICQFLDTASFREIKYSPDSLEIGVSVVDFKNGQFELKSSADYGYNDFTNWIWGSANEPLFMSYHTTSSSFYVDGGVRQNIPLEIAVEYSQKHNIGGIDVIINKPLNPITDTSFVPTSIFGGLTRLIEIWEVQIRNDNLMIGKLLSELGRANAKQDSSATGDNGSKDFEIRYYYFPSYLYESYKNELVFDKEKMKLLWETGRKGIKDIRTGTRGAQTQTIKISKNILQQYRQLDLNQN